MEPLIKGPLICYLHLLTCFNGTYRSLGHRYNLWLRIVFTLLCCIFLYSRPVHLTRRRSWDYDKQEKIRVLECRGGVETWKVPKGYLEFMEKTLRGLFLGSNLEEFVRVVKDRFPDCPTEVCKELHSGHFQL